MAITYSYKITQISMAPALDGLSDVVTHVRFTYTGVDEKGNEASFQGAIPMPAPDSEHFTPLADLTEAEVIEWVKATHPIAHMQEVIQRQIAEKITPTNQEVPLPWVPQTTTTTTTIAE